MSVKALAVAVSVATALPIAAHADPPPALQEVIETCAACHGKDGVSEIEGTPSLAGQPDVFLQYQLVFIRDGQRKVEVMQEMAKTLTDENIRDLGAYYAALPPPPAFPSDHAVDEGKVTELMQSRRCGNCHKEDYSGQGETARLAGQRPDYLVKALADFRAGVRRGRGLGAMMEVSVTLRDQEIEMIAAYLARKP